MTPRPGLVAMTKLEVVVGGEDVAAVGEVLTAGEARGYTVLSGVSGMGHGGYHQGRLLFNDRDGLRLVLTVVPDDRADGIIEALLALLEERPGVLFVTETYVSRPDYFS
jgi:nitrogen regulatory protein PII